MGRVFAIGPGDGIYAAQLNIQHYKVQIKCEVEQSRKRSRALP